MAAIGSCNAMLEMRLQDGPSYQDFHSAVVHSNTNPQWTSGRGNSHTFYLSDLERLGELSAILYDMHSIQDKHTVVGAHMFTEALEQLPASSRGAVQPTSVSLKTIIEDCKVNKPSHKTRETLTLFRGGQPVIGVERQTATLDLEFEVTRFENDQNTFKLEISASKYPRKGSVVNTLEIILHEDHSISRSSIKPVSTQDEPRSRKSHSFNDWAFNYSMSQSQKASGTTQQAPATTKSELKRKKSSTHSPTLKATQLEGTRNNLVTRAQILEDVDSGDGLPPGNFEIKDDFTQNAVHHACMQFCAQVDSWFMFLVPMFVFMYFGLSLYQVGAGNLTSRFFRSDRAVIFELVDLTNPTPQRRDEGVCWQYMYKEEYDPYLAALKPSSTACDREPITRVVTWTFVVILLIICCFLVMTLMSFFKYVWALLQAVRGLLFPRRSRLATGT